MVTSDCCGAGVAILAALVLQDVASSLALQPWWQIPLVALIVVGCTAASGLYNAIIRYIALREAFRIIQTAASAAALLYLAGLAWSAPLLQPALIANFGIVLVLTLSAGRILARHILGAGADADAERVVIYGAGEAGVQLARALATDWRRRVVGFVDDDPKIAGSSVAGLPVFAAAALPACIAKKRIAAVLLAIPGASRRRKQEVIRALESLPVRFKTIPSLRDILAGRAQISDVRTIDVEELLGRDPVSPYPELLSRSIVGQTVMVTGAGGSIGSALCRRIVMVQPAHLVLFEANEGALFAIERELRAWLTETGVVVRVTAILGNVLDRELVTRSIRHFAVDTIYHAAAYKHVPLVEHNVSAGLLNNVIGTRNVAEAAVANGVRRFIFISTDKAVRPTNVMGATKRVAEQIVQGLAAAGRDAGGPGCILSMVRFGNVLGSSGSVVHIFREQIRGGGPVTVTDRDITRFFMTIPEAAELVIQAGAMALGGEVFVLDMGEPIRIVDLARRMIHLAGSTVRDQDNPDGEIELVFTGLRPGEKRYEELLIASSSVRTGHAKIGCAEEAALAWSELAPLVEVMQHAANRLQGARVKKLLQRAVPEYAATEQDYDAFADDDAEAPGEDARSGHANVVPLN